MKPRQEDVFEEFGREFIRRRRAPRPPRLVERILAATDFSLYSIAALEYAEDLARHFAAELVVMHAEEAPLAGAELTDVTHAAAERELSRTVAQLRADGVAARGRLCPGAAPDEIVRAAAGERASLIVVGTHGRTGLAHVLMGSVAERVVRDAPCPVLTVGRHADALPASRA